jgi:NTP pyrophosphatase (non-canonical NTP hydrolase)
MTYYLYHIPHKKIGVTRDLKKRVEEQQGYKPSEYAVILESDDINYISEQEIYLQKFYGYRVDEVPYNKLKFNKEENNMNINITEQTTTFPCPVNKLKGQLMDNIGMTWDTDHGIFFINEYSIKWIMANVKTSMFNKQRSYIYNKAFARFYDNHQTHDYPSNGKDQYDGKTLAGGLSPERVPQCCDEYNPCNCKPYYQFDLIRDWAEERGLYANGDPKTQALKLVEEVGETCRAILKEDYEEVVDGIGDCVVVLTNLAELMDISIEDCIAAAYDEIKDRTGQMENGTYKKD